MGRRLRGEIGGGVRRNSSILYRYIFMQLRTEYVYTQPVRTDAIVNNTSAICDLHSGSHGVQLYTQISMIE